ncbi:MAG: hypothetical protein M1821_006802 [Bathelium mastoideum]|nr:MAG: hypothetical protein M1821_006802 [Bathelium mastoideum]
MDQCTRQVLKVPVHEQIRQLIVSPHEEYLAIVTSHTVHVAIIPDASHLGSPEPNFKPKTFQLGPTAHVLDRSPVASVLWHPLGVNGTCLVTITKDATVRVWELSRENRYSFDEPTLAVDLKKLANATSYEEDFKALRPGVSKGFSPDDLEMEVAAACFGGSGDDDEHGWSSMTLWMAMTEGDLYALCPLLPSKWQPSSTQIPSLSTSVVAKTAAVHTDPGSAAEERRKADQQYKWFQDIDDQEPITLDGGIEPPVEVYKRPESLSPIPRLQGPFVLEPETDVFGDITDVYVAAPKVDVDELNDEDDYENSDNSEDLAIAILCISTSSGYVHVCLDVDGVEGQWLPLKPTKHRTEVEEALPTLLLVETIEISRVSSSEEDSYLTFTPDPNSRYASFITHNKGISYISFSPWTWRLEDELKSASESGSSFRVDVLLDGLQSLIEHPIQITRDKYLNPQNPSPLASALAFKDPSTGYFLLTTASGQPHAATLDLPDSDIPPPFETPSASSYYYPPSSPYHPTTSTSLTAFAPDPTPPPRQEPPRAPYQPSPTFWLTSALPGFLPDAVAQRDRHLVTAELRLSARSLGLLQQAHRILSRETQALGGAAAELFTRAERLVRELREQVLRLRMLRERVEGAVGGGEEGEGGEREKTVARERVEERVEGVRRRQVELGERWEALRRKVGALGGRELSVKEVAWRREVEGVDEMLMPLREEGEGREGEDERGLIDRFEEVKRLTGELVKQGRDVVKDAAEQATPTSGNHGDQLDRSNGVRVAPAFRKAKVAEVEEMLERESALVEATMEKLERLKLQPL